MEEPSGRSWKWWTWGQWWAGQCQGVLMCWWWWWSVRRRVSSSLMMSSFGNAKAVASRPNIWETTIRKSANWRGGAGVGLLFSGIIISWTSLLVWCLKRFKFELLAAVQSVLNKRKHSSGVSLPFELLSLQMLSASSGCFGSNQSYFPTRLFGLR